MEINIYTARQEFSTVIPSPCLTGETDKTHAGLKVTKVVTNTQPTFLFFEIYTGMWLLAALNNKTTCKIIKNMANTHSYKLPRQQSLTTPKTSYEGAKPPAANATKHHLLEAFYRKITCQHFYIYSTILQKLYLSTGRSTAGREKLATL